LQESSLFCVCGSRFADTLQELALFLTKEGNFVNQNKVLVHLGKAVFVTDLGFFLNSLAERFATVFEESLLVNVFLLNVGVHLFVLHRLVLDVFIKTVVDSTLQLVVVVDILGYPVDCSLESLDVAFVTANLSSVQIVCIVEVLLFVLECVYDATESSVDSVKMHHFIVHGLCQNFQIHNFLLLGSSLNFEFLDFVIKHIFEFFQFLSLSLLFKNKLLTQCDLLISVVNGSSLVFLGFL
jgi:hypothetical protein